MTTPPPDPGNAAMIRRLAGQFFEEWESRQGKHRASWPAWVALALSVFGIVFAAGSLRSEVATANVRLEKLEVRADASDKTATSVNDRLARIETKLDLVLERRR